MFVATLILLLVYHATDAQIPQSPCPQIFNYFESPTLGSPIFGAVTFNNDLSGVYDLEINMTVPINTKDNIVIMRQSSDLDIQSGRPLKYLVVFPKNGIVPELVSVTFNNQLYCYRPAREGPVVTTLSRRNILKTGVQPQRFQPAQNFEAKPPDFQTKPQSKPQSFPQNFELEPQVEPQNFEPQSSRPNGFDPKPQNFNSRPEIEPQNFEPPHFRPQTPNNFHSKPQNFAPKPQHFPQKPQSIEPQISRPQNNVETSHFLHQSTNVFPPQFDRPIATTPRRTTPPIISERTTQQPLTSTNHLQVAPPQLQSNNKAQDGRTQCGSNIDFQPLVFSGASTRRGEYPWLVAMFYLSNRAYNFRCAGSLVSTRHVVTAAHCIRIIGRPDINREDVLIVMGKHNLKHWAAQSTIKGVSEFLVHPDFKGPGDADIAVVLLDGEVQYSATVSALCLWADTDHLEEVVGSAGVVAGWGRDETGRDVVEEPSQITMPIVSQETCLRSDERFLKLTSRRTFCAGSRNGSIPCTGDSGGGFFLKRNGKWILRGVVSVALVDPNTRSCDGSHYAVFSDVPKYKPWLSKAMKVT